MQRSLLRRLAPPSPPSPVSMPFCPCSPTYTTPSDSFRRRQDPPSDPACPTQGAFPSPSVQYMLSTNKGGTLRSHHVVLCSPHHLRRRLCMGPRDVQDRACERLRRRCAPRLACRRCPWPVERSRHLSVCTPLSSVYLLTFHQTYRCAIVDVIYSHLRSSPQRGPSTHFPSPTHPPLVRWNSCTLRYNLHCFSPRINTH